MSDDGFVLKSKVLDNQEKFIKQLLFSSKNIVCNDDFNKIGLYNKNMMFFLNYIIEILSSISMLGSRNLNNSLLGKIEKIINYYNDINKQFESESKQPTIPEHRKKYIQETIKKNNFINAQDKRKYLQFVKTNDTDSSFVENLKLVYISLIDNKYFEKISDELYDLVTDNSTEIANFDRIADLTNEYISLLIDYIGISVFEIKRIIRDAFRGFFEKKYTSFENLFMNFAQQYKHENEYIIIVKMNKEYNEKLVSALKQSGTSNYTLYNKIDLEQFLNEYNINNKKNLNEIVKKYCLAPDNNYFISSTLFSKDIWQAIRKFKQNVLQPFIGTMLYSGFEVNNISEFIVIENKNEKKFINSYNYYDDIFKPLTQDRIDYGDVFKRYIIDNDDNNINRIIDEAVQLLPYYKTSESTLTKFTNTWFALETLFRNAGPTITKSLEDCASYLVADRMISGYIYLTAVQIKKMYSGFEKQSNIFVENVFINFENKNPNNCDFITWKYNRVLKMINNYDIIFQDFHLEAKELLMDAYYTRNKQFHGNKNLNMEAIAGFLYDIVNDTIEFYIDYIDVYRDSPKNTHSLFNFIRNIKDIKNILIKETDDIYEKISIAYDSVRKI